MMLHDPTSSLATAQRPGRMKRLAGRVLLLLSTLASLAVATLWLRSYWASDHVMYNDELTVEELRFMAASGEGTLGFSFGTTNWDDLEDATYIRQHAKEKGFALPSGLSWGTAPVGSLDGLGLTNFQYNAHRRNGQKIRSTLYEIKFPYWTAVVLSALFPAVRLFGLMRTRRRIQLGLCPNCGFDLRASSGRCPECGKVLGPECPVAPL